MKKNKNQLERIKSLINCDRVALTDDFILLIEKDLNVLFSEYFEVKSGARLMLEKGTNEYKVSVFLSVVNVKNFITVPKTID